MSRGRSDRVPGEISTPTFCPRCRRPGEEGDALCPRCGEALRTEGYCPICEGWVMAPPGSACPKHEVDLEDGPEQTPRDASSRMVTVATYALTGESYAARLRLEAEGIPVFLDGERMGQNAIYQVATGGVKLQVPEECAGDARILLSQSWAPPKEDEDDWEGLEPDPGEKRRSVMKYAIVVYLFGPIALFLIAILLGLFSR